MTRARRRVPIRLMLYWDHQGDAAAKFQAEYKGDPLAALSAMADDLVESAEALRGVVMRLDGARGIRLTAAGRLLVLEGVPRALATEAVKHTKGCAAITD